MLPQPSKNRGFTLLEMSIVIVVAGIVLSTLSTVLPTLISSAKTKQAKAVTERFELALNGYFLANGRFPCPDTSTPRDGIEDRNLTDPNICTSYVGGIPYSTIWLSSGNDPWNNPIKYAVQRTLVTTTRASDATNSCNVLDFIMSNPPPPSPPPPPGWPYTVKTDGTNISYKAYIIVSGGAKDRDNAGGFFDGMNTNTDNDFEELERFESNNYDDIVRAVAFPTLKSQACLGAIPGSNTNGNTIGEHIYSNGCTNGIDDDGDSPNGIDNIDCKDSDCYGQPSCGGETNIFKISTSSLNTAYVKQSSYTALLTGDGGTPPYKWKSVSGLTCLEIKDFNSTQGILSSTGALNLCPGSHLITVSAEDSESKPASRTLALNIEKNLIVTGSESIRWSTPSQTAEFSADNGFLGKISWKLEQTSPASATSIFQCLPVGDDNCTFGLKNLTITPAENSTYKLKLTATDTNCPSNTATKEFTVTTLTGSNDPLGTIGGTIDSLSFDTPAYYPKITPISGDYYLLAYHSASSYGKLRLVRINTDGTPADTELFTYLGSSTNPSAAAVGATPDVIKVNDELYTVISHNSTPTLYARTYKIDTSATNATQAFSRSDIVSLGVGAGGRLAQVNSNVLAVTFRASGNGYIRTFGSSDSGLIEERVAPTTVYSRAIFPNSFKRPGSSTTVNIRAMNLLPSIEKVTSDIYAVAYPNVGRLTTIKIGTDGALAATSASQPYAPFIDSVRFDEATAATHYGYDPHMVHVGGDVYAIAYRYYKNTAGFKNRGSLVTMKIAADGKISLPASNTYDFTTSNNSCFQPRIIKVTENIFAILYLRTEVKNSVTYYKGNLITVGIANSGAITPTVLSSYSFLDNYFAEPDIIHVRDNIFAIVYRGSSNKGMIKTVSINAGGTIQGNGSDTPDEDDGGGDGLEE